MGADGIEIDVRLLEGELVVLHDARLDRTTSGSGLLSSRSLAYVRALDAGAGERVPLLHEVVEAAFAIHPQALINIELKGRRTAGPVAEFLRALPGDLRDHFLVSSFHRTELRLLRGFGLRLGILFARSGVRFRRLADALQAWSVHLPLRHVTARAVERIHAHGQKVFVYTVNAPQDFARLREMGVDGVFTDFPDRGLPPGRDPALPGGEAARVFD